MSALNVMVINSDSKESGNWAEIIDNAAGNAHAFSLNNKEFRDMMMQLTGRIKSWRNNPNIGYQCDHAVDSADVVVIDYDLFGLTNSEGERIAYLLRCFSKCGIILMVDKFCDNTYDISKTNVIKDFADMHIGSDQLSNPGLWNDSSSPLPWHLPVVSNVIANFGKCVDDVESHIDVPVMQSFNFESDQNIPYKNVSPFMQWNKRLFDVTFADVVNESASGLYFKDRVPDSQMHRIAAARVMTLLNRLIVPAQCLLVDAPHLIPRLPSLSEYRGTLDETWSLYCHKVEPDAGYPINSKADKHKFENAHWLWTPAWIWPSINQDESIMEVRDPWSKSSFDVDRVFCEDTSQFVRESSARKVRFWSDIEPPFHTRWISRPAR